MRGILLGYDPARGEGIVSGTDEQRYRFPGVEYRGDVARLRPGVQLDFDVRDGAAVDVYLLQQASQVDRMSNKIGGLIGGPNTAANFTAPTVPKSNVTAGILALLLGGLGVHKFYLGYMTQGWVLLGSSILSWLLLFVGIGLLGLLAIGAICLAEAIILLTKDQREFEEQYLTGAKPWF